MLLPLGVGCSTAADAGDKPASTTKSQGGYSYTAEQQAALAEYDVMPESAVLPLRLQRIALIPLGRSSTEFPAAIGSLKMTDSTLLVIDPAARRLRFYDRRGTATATVSFDSAGTIRHTAPAQAATLGDTLFVVDMDMRRGVVTYDGRGHRLAKIPVSVPGATDLAAIKGQRVISTMPNEDVVANGEGAVLWNLAPNGRAEPFGCVPDAWLRSSMKNKTAYAVFRFTGVAAANGRFYCRQALSPVVQIVGADGTAQGAVRRAPAFYKRGPGVSQRGLDEAGMEQFRSTWTEHGRFFPRPSGFVSLYMMLDKQAKTDRQFVFACDSAAGPTRCGTGELKGRPLDFRAPDTLVVAEPDGSAQAAPQIGLYLVRLP